MARKKISTIEEADQRAQDRAVRKLAGTKFDAIPADRNAFPADKWAKRSFEDGMMHRMALVILGKDDLEVERLIYDDASVAAMAEAMEKFNASADQHRSAAEVFDAVTTRLTIALARYSYQLDPDGNPVKSTRN